MEFYTGISHFHNYLPTVPEESSYAEPNPSAVMPNGWIIEDKKPSSVTRKQREAEQYIEKIN